MTEESKVEEKKCNCKEECTCGCQDGLECTCDENCNCNNEENKCDCKDNIDKQECCCEKCDHQDDKENIEKEECTCTSEHTEDKKEEKKKKGLFHKKNDEKLLEAYNKISELEDKLIRKDAEIVNYRKRREEEFSRMMKFANEGLIKDLLPVIDNFERALNLSEGNQDPAFMKLNEGYKMVYCGLENILTKFEVKAIDGANKPFDPVYHNAVMLEPKEGVESGTVIEVLQKGYLYKDKVIRPAMVKVNQ